MNQLIEQWKELPYYLKKIRRSNLFFLFALGPFLLISSLSVALFQLSNRGIVFPILMIVSLITSYKWRLRGFAISSLLFLSYFSFTTTRELFFWDAFFTISLLTGLLITSLLSEEVARFLKHEWKVKDGSVKSLSNYSRQLVDLRDLNQSLQVKLHQMEISAMDAREYGHSLKKLIDVSRSLSESLREENLALAGELEKFEQKKEAPLSVPIDQDSPLLDELNQYRVESYQLRLLLETYEEELEKYKKMDAQKSRLLFEKSSKQAQPTQQLDFLAPKGEEMQRIMALTQEKELLRKEYQKLLTDHQKISDQLEESILDAKFHDDESYLRLNEELLEKNEILRQTRKELFDLEGELLAVQKERDEEEFDLTEKELRLQEYLRFTDQQCHRLEEENKNLREIISTLSQSKSHSPLL